jgi:hypothetical protein
LINKKSTVRLVTTCQNLPEPQIETFHPVGYKLSNPAKKSQNGKI